MPFLVKLRKIKAILNVGVTSFLHQITNQSCTTLTAAFSKKYLSETHPSKKFHGMTAGLLFFARIWWIFQFQGLGVQLLPFSIDLKDSFLSPDGRVIIVLIVWLLTRLTESEREVKAMFCWKKPKIWVLSKQMIHSVTIVKANDTPCYNFQSRWYTLLQFPEYTLSQCESGKLWFSHSFLSRRRNSCMQE